MRHAHRTLGLSDDEYQMIIATLGRDPLPVELAMYSVMWSEHCSYKSSRVHLRRLPTEGSAVLVGPGENAGVVDVGDGIAIALRMESHNHPSAVEPYQGAATGVGGILRDVFTMGARPIALMDVLCLGPIDSAHSRYIFDGVVRGIGGYGNAVGVPTVGGQLSFAPCYKDNPLVNVLCVGVLPIDRLVLSKASGTGNLVVLLGSLTGRDGIGGVSVLASAGFVPDEDGRTRVQVGDPFEEKRLIEACLELLDQHLVVAIQDLGGAGLACATSETAARGGVGMDIDIAAVPLREKDMSAVDVMTSESQERMLAIVEPSAIDAVLACCSRHDVRATVIGTVSASDGTGRLVIRDSRGASSGATAEIVADLPAASLADEAPLYHRPMSPPAAAAGTAPSSTALLDISDALLALLYDPSFVFHQYDHQLFLNTVVPPGGGDATVLKLASPGISWGGKGLALTCDANPAWCAVSPRAGAELTVAEAWLNIACVGARPLAIVDCLNFGNPEHEEVMWQLSEVVDGIAAACRAFHIPVVGGNVSLYNESDGRDIDPTPVIGLVGLIEHLARRPPGICLAQDGAVVLLGDRRSPGDPIRLGGSRWARELGGHGAELPQLDFEAHGRLCALVSRLVAAECAGKAEVPIVGLHDVSDGGLGVCLAELCCASGQGIIIEEPWSNEELFCEAPSRVVVCSNDPEGLLAAARSHGVVARVVGRVGGDRLFVPGLFALSVKDMVSARSGRLAGP
ncbi:MAG: phosphoribosylformylglycinamidine synthase subunit PurL [Acidimicrobiales bacterium]